MYVRKHLFVQSSKLLKMMPETAHMNY